MGQKSLSNWIFWWIQNIYKRKFCVMFWTEAQTFSVIVIRNSSSSRTVWERIVLEKKLPISFSFYPSVCLSVICYINDHPLRNFFPKSISFLYRFFQSGNNLSSDMQLYIGVMYIYMRMWGLCILLLRGWEFAWLESASHLAKSYLKMFFNSDHIL